MKFRDINNINLRVDTNVDIDLFADYEKFNCDFNIEIKFDNKVLAFKVIRDNIDIDIKDANITNGTFLKILIMRYLFNVFFIANINIIRRYRLLENLYTLIFFSKFTYRKHFFIKYILQV